MPDNRLLEMTTDVVSAFVSNNKLTSAELPALVRAVHASLAGAEAPSLAAEDDTPKATPAQIRRSIRPDALISFEDGKPYKTLKRHLTSRGLTFSEYQEKWSLPKDYPSVAPAYAAQRSELAKAAGLGQKGKAAGKVTTLSNAGARRSRSKAG